MRGVGDRRALLGKKAACQVEWWPTQSKRLELA